jgi:hypothetical protein
MMIIIIIIIIIALFTNYRPVTTLKNLSKIFSVKNINLSRSILSVNFANLRTILLKQIYYNWSANLSQFLVSWRQTSSFILISANPSAESYILLYCVNLTMSYP